MVVPADDGGRIDPYATHLEALVETALGTTGPILELGCGDYSTPVLRAICEAQGRSYIGNASNTEWAKRFGVSVVDWNSWKEPKGMGMIFLDNEECVEDRVRRLAQLSTDTVVMHDADIALKLPIFEQCAAKFPNRKVYDKQKPWTLVLRK